MFTVNIFCDDDGDDFDVTFNADDNNDDNISSATDSHSNDDLMLCDRLNKNGKYASGMLGKTSSSLF